MLSPRFALATLAVLWGIVCAGYFRERRYVPSRMIMALPGSLLACGVLALLASRVDPECWRVDVGEELTQTFKTLLPCAIWVPYFLVSKRVKQTYVR